MCFPDPLKLMLGIYVESLLYWFLGECAIRTKVHSIYLIDAHSLHVRIGIHGKSQITQGDTIGFCRATYVVVRTSSEYLKRLRCLIHWSQSGRELRAIRKPPKSCTKKAKSA